MELRHFWFSSLLIFCCYNYSLCQHNNVGDTLLQCYQKDKTKLESCLIQFWSDVFKLMKTGVPELNIPVSDPFIINSVEWNDKGAAIKVTGKLSNFKLSGLSNSVCTAIKIDKKNREVRFNMTTPVMNITADYSINGSILLIPINGKGKLSVNATGITTLGRYNVLPQGTGVRMENLDMDLRMDKMSLIFSQDVYDPVWDAINQLISENTQLLFDDIKPLISGKFSPVVIQLGADGYKKMPAEAFL